jgi:hypothetical protein
LLSGKNSTVAVKGEVVVDSNDFDVGRKLLEGADVILPRLRLLCVTVMLLYRRRCMNMQIPLVPLGATLVISVIVVREDAPPRSGTNYTQFRTYPRYSARQSRQPFRGELG